MQVLALFVAIVVLLGLSSATTFSLQQSLCFANTTVSRTGDVNAECATSGACKRGLYCDITGTKKCTAPAFYAAGATCTDFIQGVSRFICPVGQFCSAASKTCVSRLAVGADCTINADTAFNPQCAFGHVCNGKCVPIRSVTEGGVCDIRSPYVCATGTYCKRDSATVTAGKCAAFVARGAACDSSNLCGPEDYCKTTCVARLAENIDCSSNLDRSGCQNGLTCNTAGKKCQRRYSGAVDAACDNNVQCQVGLYCMPTAGSTDGKCAVGKKTGEDCTVLTPNCVQKSACSCNGQKFVCGFSDLEPCLPHFTYSGPINDVAAQGGANENCCGLSANMAEVWPTYRDAVCAFSGAVTLKIAVAPFILVAAIVFALLL